MMNEFWNEYLKNSGTANVKKAKACICFGASEKDAASACEKICAGAKKAEIYPRNGYRCAMSGMPEAGDLNIVTDWMGNPVALIETTGVRAVKLGDVTDEMCKLEGDCASFEEWQEKKMPSIRLEAEELGVIFDDDMDLIIEEFRLVYSR